MASVTYDTLSNGMRVLHMYSDAVSEICGVFIDTGSRDDPPGLPGMAHFVEHTIFKGTKHRRAWHINNRMEAVGGELNAFTAKEETFVYAVGPSGSFPRGAELVADLVSHATFPDAEVGRERGVVCDEIDSYDDTPADAVFDLFEDNLFEKSQIGHPILGYRESVGRMTPDDCRQFVHGCYTASRMVFFYGGKRAAKEVFRCAERYFGSLPSVESSPQRIVPNVVPVFDIDRRCSHHQTNTVIGGRVCSATDRLRHPLALVANILGGPGMNSLLNTALREKRGLVYSVDASVTFYTDCGMFAVAYGCDPDDDKRCRKIVFDTISRLRDNLAPRRLEQAKRQFAGQLTVASDNRENMLFSAVRTLYRQGKPRSAEDMIKLVEEINVDDVANAMDSYLTPSILSIATI